MQYDVKSPPEYFRILQEDWRKELLLNVRYILLSQSEILKESIEYKMLSYQLRNKTVFHLNAQKHFVGLYIGSIDKLEGSEKIRQSFDCGKGCIRIKKGDMDKLNLLNDFIRKVIEKEKMNEDIGC